MFPLLKIILHFFMHFFWVKTNPNSLWRLQDMMRFLHESITTGWFLLFLKNKWSYERFSDHMLSLEVIRLERFFITTGFAYCKHKESDRKDPALQWRKPVLAIVLKNISQSQKHFLIWFKFSWKKCALNDICHLKRGRNVNRQLEN